MSPREQSSFSTSAILRALGVRSRRQLPIETGGIQPVALLADYSSSFAPEAFEARVVMAGTLASQAPHSSLMHLVQVRAVGGIVVEYCNLSVNVAGDICFVQVVDATPPGVWGALPAGGLFSVGGAEPRCVGWLGYNIAPVVANPMVAKYNTLWLPTDRFFVAAGKFLLFGSFTATPAAFSTTHAVTFREIPEMPGSP